MQKSSSHLFGRRARQATHAVLLLAAICVSGDPSHAQERQETAVQLLRIGVLSTEGATRALEAWTPTVELLNSTAERQALPYRYQIQPQTDLALLDGIQNGNLDLFIADPATFVVAEVEMGARALLSVSQLWDGKSYNRTGALAFVSAESDIQTLEEIAGHSIMGGANNEDLIWNLALQQLRKNRIEPDSLSDDILFSGGNQREVVYAVQSGLVDVGIVDAGMLEKLETQNVIDLKEFRPLSPLVNEDFPFLVSTPLLPDWLMGAASGLSEDALALTINTLLAVETGSTVSVAAGNIVWQAPQNYQPVHELLISLRARPYEQHLMKASQRIFQRYRPYFLTLLALAIGSVVFLVWQLRRNARLAEARKNVLESERRSKEFYRNAVEQHSVFCMLNMDGTISHVNQEFAGLLEERRQNLLTRSFADLLGPADRTTLEKSVMPTVTSGTPWQGALKFLGAQGKPAWVECTVIPVTGAGKKPTELAIVASDITQTRVGASTAGFHDTLDLMRDPVFVLSADNFAILHANAAGEKRLKQGRRGGDWRGKSVSDFITVKDMGELQTRAESLRSGKSRRLVWEAETKDGTTYEISMEPVQSQDDVSKFVAIYRDVTARKTAEKAKKEFVATVSHELRTPLTAIKGALGIMGSGTVDDQPERRKSLLKMATTSTDRLMTLISDILDVEQIENGKMKFNMEPVDLWELAEDACAGHGERAQQRGIALELLGERPEPALMTYGDRGKLLQVLNNLLSNAVKFSAEGDKITLDLAERDKSVRITVRDRGTGIPDHAKDTIFEKFTQADSSDTRSKGGTGLGLSIAKSIVAHHRGDISFDSKEKEGSAFFVDLPRLVEDSSVISLRPADEEPERLRPAAPVQQAAPKGGEQVSVVQPLIERARQNGWTTTADLDQGTVKQLAQGGRKASGLLLDLFEPAVRQAMEARIEDWSLQNAEVALVEILVSDTNAAAVTEEATSLACDWLSAGVRAAQADRQAPAVTRLIAMDEAAFASLPPSMQQSATVVPEGRQDDPTVYDGCDALVISHKVYAVQGLSLLPLQRGNLPKGWPMLTIATRQTSDKNARGVISKYGKSRVTRL